jgi:curli biogenesis system outer membrane secretion channel CsgG
MERLNITWRGYAMRWLYITGILLAITASLLGACQIPGENWGWEDAWLDKLVEDSVPNEADKEKTETDGDTSSVTAEATEKDTSPVTTHVTEKDASPVSAHLTEEKDTSSVTAHLTEEKDISSVTADQVQYPPYHGPKKTLAVLEFENKAKGSYGELFNSKRFILVERSALKEILKEQELGQTGLIRTETAARVGSLAGAQLLIKGVVSEFEYRQAGKGLGFGIEQFRLGLKSSNAHVGIDVRVIDATTGQIIASECASAKAKSSGFSIDYVDDDTPLQVGTSAFNKTPLGVATREAVHKAVQFIIGESEKHVWSGAVIKASRSIAYINRGANSNIHPGNRLTVYSCGEELIDPQTGINLGSIEQRVGTLIITDVLDKFSIGRLQMEIAGAPVKRGDIVRFE